MYGVYYFDFLKTLSVDLKDALDGLPVTPLDATALSSLRTAQAQNQTPQGVYVVHYNGHPVYVGKANDVSDRLGQHLQKLSGRIGIDLFQVGYKALLLDASMSTAANEDLLISIFRSNHLNMWNGTGFGPKDPGQNRDTTAPGWFDRTHPIKVNFPVNLVAYSPILLRDLLVSLKAQLPFVFRYDVPRAELNQIINLNGINPDARSLLQAVVTFLGAGWKGAVLSYGMVLYKTTKQYPFGEEIVP